jgi:predicted dehydrogenase
MKKVRLGIIGMGNMGSQHYMNILSGKCPELEVVAVSDINSERLEWARTTNLEHMLKDPTVPELKLFENSSELIASGLADAVIVATPHYSHPAYSIEAMKHGLHVMCEKPVGVYIAQVREMIEEADKHPELKFAAMFNQRTNCLYRKIKEIMDSGELGEMRRTVWLITNWYRPQAYYNSSPWRATWAGEGGGVLLNQCPHNLDLWQWICGMPSKVYAKIGFGKWRDIEVDDDVMACVEYPNGATGMFVATTADIPGNNRLEIVCDKGTIICDASRVMLHRLEISESQFSKINKEPYAYPHSTTEIVETDGKNEQHIGVLNAFAAAILRDEPLVADGREGINSLMISNAMHLSAWTNREVDIPFNEDQHYALLEERIRSSKAKSDVKYVFSEFNKTHSKIL